MKLSPPELAIALVNGRRFMTETVRTLYFDKSITVGSPFKCVGHKTLTSMSDSAWSDYDLTEIIEWYDTATKENPVLCWVSDENSQPGKGGEITLITQYNPGQIHPFMDIKRYPWKYATPVTPNDCYKETT